MESSTTLIVDSNGSRLDRYITNRLSELSRAAVQRLIGDGHILVDNSARKPSYRVQIGETVSIFVPLPKLTELRAEQIPLDIIYEDGDLIVVNKPAGMVVHPAAGHDAGTLVNAILAHCPNLNVGGMERPGIVHRLDKDTSGLIVVAKNDAALRDLQAQFKSRRVHKTYLALVQGRVHPPRGKIDAPIGRDPKYRQKMAVRPIPESPSLTRKGARGLGRAREAVTNYRTLASLEDYSLVAAEPVTGRTHQVRVHLAFLGFPIIGDSIYGKKKNALGLMRQFLHAWKIEFKLPRDGRAVNFTAPLSEDLIAVLEKLEIDLVKLAQ